MGKKKAKKEEQNDVIISNKTASKDIDDIFSAKKNATIDSVTDTKAPSKPLRTKSVDKVNDGPENLEDVEKLVRAAKSKRTALMADIKVDDDFADIRGTQKRMRFSS